MSLSRKMQVELAKPLIAIDAFDVSEYLHEKMERITTGAAYTDDSWEHSAYQSLMLQLSDYPDTSASKHTPY